MKNEKEQKHFLALQTLPGKNVYIDISLLDLAGGYFPNTLEEIDAFTAYFSHEEIIKAIQRANLADQEFLNGTLCIVDNQKHKPLKVITKDYLDGFNFEQYLFLNLNDKNFTNLLINKATSLMEDNVKALFREKVKTEDLAAILEMINTIPYLKRRKLLVYLIDHYRQNKEKGQELKLDKAA